MAGKEKMKTTPHPGRNRVRLRLLSLGSLIAFVLLWQFCVAPEGVHDWRVPHTMLSPPSEVAALFVDKLTNPKPDGETLVVHAWVSMQEAFLGYLLALLVGLPLGLAMGWFKTVRGLFRPLFEMIRPIPPVAWIPLTVFWFGIGLGGKVFIIWMSGVVPCVINAYIGVSMVNPTYINMSRTYGATNWQIFTRICIPSALPMVFGALQIALVYCWITLVAAELLASDKGIGYLITTGRFLGRTDLVLVGMVSVGLTGALISLIIDRIEARLLAGLRR
jgi:NitT/TauT family transport system permease protein